MNMKISCFEDFVTAARQVKAPAKVAVVEACDENTLQSVVHAARDGIISPILIGDAAEIAATLPVFGASADEFEIIPSNDADASLEIAAALVREGKANALMKGLIDTGRFMKMILNKENHLLQGQTLSLIGFYETPRYHKLFAVTDFGLNTYPDLMTKKAIVENAVGLLRRLGVTLPKVAALSATEKVNPKMPDSVDAHALKEMNARGEITGCIVEGPIAFDLATSAEAAKIKRYSSPVAGDADLLLVPDFVCGNMLVKCLTGFGGARTAGTVLGARVPVILTSRSSEADDKYYSIALAACAAAGR
jgi:phosphotransacetylase